MRELTTFAMCGLIGVLGVCWEAAAGSGRPGDAPAIAAEPDGAVCVLTLAGALPQGKPLTIHLGRRDGAFKLAFATAPEFNKVPHDVDASGLTLRGNTLKGTVRVTIHSDGYVPKGRQPLACTYAIDAAVRGAAGKGRRRIEGSFEGRCGKTEVRGTLSGELGPALPRGRPARFELSLCNAVQGRRTKAPWTRWAYVRFAISHGRAYGGKIHSAGGMTHALYTGRIERVKVKFADGRLAGTVRAAVRYNSGETEAYTYTLSGMAIGDTVAGTFIAKRSGQDLEGGRFVGTIDTAAPPKADDCLYTLVLHDGAPDGKFVRVHLSCKGGSFAHGFAVTPMFNHATHDVDVAGLTLRGAAVKGRLDVTVNPDPYVPKDRKPIACSYDVDAVVRDAEVTGRFKGSFGTEAVAGDVTGHLQRRRKLPRSIVVWLKMEEGVTGGAAWHNRTYITVALRDGKVVKGSFSNNKGAWKGTFDAAELKVDPSALAGTITCTVTSGRVVKGTYIFALSGKFVGAYLVGTYQSRRGERIVKSGSFVGSVSAAPQQELSR